MKNSTKAIIASTLAATAVGAQSLPSGVDTRGYVELSYTSTDFSDDVVLTGDFDIMVGPNGFGSGVPLGFDFGLEGVAGGDGGSAKAIYAAVSYTFVGFGKFSAGAPRSSYDSVVRSHYADTYNFYASPNERFAFASALSNYAIAADEQSYGIRYDSDVRPVQVSLSYNTIDVAGTDIDSTSVALKFSYAFWVAGAAYEHVSIEGGPSFDNYKIGGGADLGEYKFGLNYVNNGIFVVDDFSAWEAYFTYQPTAQIALTASVVDFSFTSENSYGLSAKYTFWNDAYAELTASRPAELGDVYQLNVGWDF